jgi:hypothetical protein
MPVNATLKLVLRNLPETRESAGMVYMALHNDGFQIVSEKFYTVDDFNPHITKFNKMIIVWHLAISWH